MYLWKKNMPRAFLIEDYDDLGLVFTEALRSAGFDVSRLATEQAPSSLAGDALLVVYDLPGLENDAETYTQFVGQAASHAKPVAIAAITASDAVAARIRAQGGTALVKPVGYKELSRLAASVILTFEDITPVQ